MKRSQWTAASNPYRHGLERYLSTAAETYALFVGGSIDDYSGYESEHILIGDDIASDELTAETIESTHKIVNRQSGKTTEITLYREGFVRFREGPVNRIEKDYLVELAFIDPRFQNRFRIARGWLGMLAISILGIVGALYLLPMTELANYRIHGATIAAMLSVMALHRFLKETGRATVFLTTTGRAPVVRILANYGCIQDARKAANALKAAVRRHCKSGKTRDEGLLREEMKFHYRLADVGAISKEICSDSAVRILAHFD